VSNVAEEDAEISESQQNKHLEECKKCKQGIAQGTSGFCDRCLAREGEINQRFNGMFFSRIFLSYLVLVAVVAIALGKLSGHYGYSLLLVSFSISIPIGFMISRAIRE
jgi:hypothetical protein